MQSARAIVAAVAAIAITFTPDHSAPVGLAIFGGFAAVTGVVLLAAAFFSVPGGARWAVVTLGIAGVVAGLVGGVAAPRSTVTFFVVVIAWAVITGIVEVVAGVTAFRLARRSSAPRSEAGDGVTVGILTLLLGVGLTLVPSGFALQYYVGDARQSFTLTATTIGVGIFGAYAAVVAVYLAIAALSPRATSALDAARASRERGAA